MTESQWLYVVCAPGLEAVLENELVQKGLIKKKQKLEIRDPDFPGEERGGIEIQGDIHAIEMINLHSRIASRVLVRLGKFMAYSFAELRRKAAQLDWAKFIRADTLLQINVTCRKSKLYHSDAVAERVAGAISDLFRQPVKTCTAAESSAIAGVQRIYVRMMQDECSVSIDSSGELLHRRGYRLETAKAPLRETLAAGLILAAGWDNTTPLIDPFCGSGTIPIEAACMARGIPAGWKREFTFMQWPNFNRVKWEANRNKFPQDKKEMPAIMGADRDAGAIRISSANAQRAGVDGDIRFACQAFSALELLEQPGWIVTNPPYGFRVRSNKDLRDLYAQTGNVLRAQGKGWRFGILCPDDYLFGQTHLTVSLKIPLNNGGIQTFLHCGQVE